MAELAKVIAFPLKQQNEKALQKPKKVVKREKVDEFNIGGHLLLGSVIGLLVAHNPISFMAVILGSLLPDIDHKNSTFGKYNPFTCFMKHRGHCHTLFGVLLLSLPFALLGAQAYTMAVIGSLGHIMGDKLNSWLPKRSKFKLRLW